MEHLTGLDLTVVVAYFAVIVLIGILVSRRERSASDYFLAGRALPWWLIGISLIASNISTEHFVGMAGSGVTFGLAIASYEWMAAVTLVIVARWFVPRLLAHGVTTMPEYLERRFDVRSRGLLAGYMLLAYVFVAMATVLYSGGLALQTIFGLPLGWGIVILAATAGAYTAYGGLKAVVWTDLVQGVALLGGGALATFLGLRAVGGWGAFREQAADKLHMVLPLDHPELPWFAVFFGGLWIANLFYWGCNQFITQRVLGARDVRQGRYGVVFAAWLKLAVPFVIVIPGIIAWTLYGAELERPDQAYPMLIARLLPPGLTGLVFAALIAAIMSSLDSMLNSTATIFTMDLYRVWLRPGSSDRHLMTVGRWSTVAFLVLAAAWAPFLLRFERVFSYIQEFWGLITPGVAVVFLGGLFWRRTSAAAAVTVLAATLPVTLALKALMAGSAFLNQMWVAGLLLGAVLVVISLRERADKADQADGADKADQAVEVAARPAPDRLFDVLSYGVIVAVVALYVVFF
jgi:SSS family solute:Na+ symporter